MTDAVIDEFIDDCMIPAPFENALLMLLAISKAPALTFASPPFARPLPPSTPKPIAPKKSSSP